ncbi:unnamed protein product [Owenia fusiformis]|uniref:Chloride channel CLIC-like protein 1 n=1 Tax=Owenia fusiformis TaxID=6347 RepID=A0A8S4MUG4_OWEFU|nr:unnamed protein product [Owenia fusiformis]
MAPRKKKCFKFSTNLPATRLLALLILLNVIFVIVYISHFTGSLDHETPQEDLLDSKPYSLNLLHKASGIFTSLFSGEAKTVQEQLSWREQSVLYLQETWFIIIEFGTFTRKAVSETVHYAIICSSINSSRCIISKSLLISLMICAVVCDVYFTWKVCFGGKTQHRNANKKVKHVQSIENISHNINDTYDTQLKSRPLKWKTIVFICALISAAISIPWEFIRLYQNEVAKKSSVMYQGMPSDCIPKDMTVWQSWKSWCMWQLSWEDSPCDKYHHALLVDPFWEVTPMLVLSSAFTRCITKPFEIICSAIGRCFKLIFSEIPSPWQPVVMLIITLVTMISVAMVCKYRIHFPLLLKIEPTRTPIMSRSYSTLSRRTIGSKTGTSCKQCSHDTNSLGDYEVIPLHQNKQLLDSSLELSF